MSLLDRVKELPSALKDLVYARRLDNGKLFASSGGNVDNHPESPLIETGLVDAQLATSKIKNWYSGDDSGYHRIILDIDVPMEVIPSSTEGHYHLVFPSTRATKSEFLEVLEALRKVGIIQQGIVNQLTRSGYVSIRLPWVKKGEDKSLAVQEAERLAGTGTEPLVQKSFWETKDPWASEISEPPF